jgi:hypothetical protein
MTMWGFLFARERGNMETSLTIPDAYRSQVQRIVQQSYDAHGVEGRAWGMAGGSCCYTCGCALELSLKARTARRADRLSPDENGIRDILAWTYPGHLTVRRQLFSLEQNPPEAVVRCLEVLQVSHDQAALDQKPGIDLRGRYRGEVEDLAERFGFHLIRHDG